MLTFNLMVSSFVLHLHGSDYDGTISFSEFQCICECHALTFWSFFPKGSCWNHILRRRNLTIFEGKLEDPFRSPLRVNTTLIVVPFLRAVNSAPSMVHI